MYQQPPPQQQPNNSNNNILCTPLVEKVELFLSCKGLLNMDLLSLSDPMCVVYSGHRSPQPPHDIIWTEIGRTEVIKDNLNPKWIKSITMDYYFERVQFLKFQVFDIDSESQLSNLRAHDFIGEVITSLAEIVGSRGQKLAKPLVLPEASKHHHGASSMLKLARVQKRGILIVAAEELSTDSNDELQFQVRANHLAKMDWFGATDGYFVISKSMTMGSGDDSSTLNSLQFDDTNKKGSTGSTSGSTGSNAGAGENYVPVYKSEVIHSNLKPCWAPVTLPLSRMCNGDLDRVLQFDCYDWNRVQAHSLVGSFRFTVNELLNNKLSVQNPRTLRNKKNKSMGEIVFMNTRVVKRYTFMEYLRGGMQMNLVIAVDWTHSNGDPRQPSSLHYNHPSQMNQYECAIRSIGDILSFYDTDQMFPCFGFGGLMPDRTVSHCFSLNGNAQDPNCFGINGVLAAYRQALQQVSLYGPTNFAPVLTALRNMAQQTMIGDTQQYYLLLLITDGIITDMNETLRMLVELASLPVSIVIVGVGDADFSAMNVLDGDEQRISYQGRFAERDCVQFVPFNKFRSMPLEVLANETLAELPQQVVQYYSNRGIAPNPRVMLPDSQFDSLIDMSSPDTFTAPSAPAPSVQQPQAPHASQQPQPQSQAPQQQYPIIQQDNVIYKI